MKQIGQIYMSDLMNKMIGIHDMMRDGESRLLH
jgi:hypothetical protein